MNHSPAISIIIPVYKAEKYIRKCMDSLLAQTFSDYEILLIDDGSPDGSGEICDEYETKDSRVRVFHKDNGGVSRARNLGIDNALGQWVVFVDSDDWVEPNYLQTMYEATANGPVEFVVSGIQYFFAHKKQYYTMFSYPDCVIDIDEMPEAIRDLQLLKNGCPVAKLYQTKIIREHHLYFNVDMSINEDHLFVIQYYNAVDKMATVHTISYNYFFDFQIPSLTKTYHSSDEFIRIAEIMSREFAKFTSRYPDITNEYWEPVKKTFGLQQIIKAIDNSIYSENPNIVLVKVRDLLLQDADGGISKPIDVFKRMRFALLLNQHYDVLLMQTYIQMKIRNFIFVVKSKIKHLLIY